MLEVQLEPETRYKFRVAAINSCGSSEWSEVCVLRTNLPGCPDPPSEIKIRKELKVFLCHGIHHLVLVGK
ncbi:Host cell factor [Blattella germanica]|nr:Host cell factor [Blattella germanica]